MSTVAAQATVQHEGTLTNAREPKLFHHMPMSVGDMVESFLKSVEAHLDARTRERLIARLRTGRSKPRNVLDPSVSRICKAYCDHADTYYQRAEGLRTSEPEAIRQAVKPLRRLLGRTPVSACGPRRFKLVREEMVRMGWCRRHINQQCGRIKRMFKWAVENEMIPATVCHALQAVQGLKAGRCAARESFPVKPVADSLVEAVLPLVSRQVAAMIRLQLLTGMRPGEACIMRTADIDQSVQPWAYRPAHHKTEHHQHERIIFLGPKAQDVIRPFLKPAQPSAYLFSPAEANLERRQRLHDIRKTPMSCGNKPGSNRKHRPRKTPGERYETHSYQRAIRDACSKLFPTPVGLDAAEAKKWRRENWWHPHQLRHSAATWLRKEYGLDVAQVVLGHKTLAVTQVYAEKDVAAAQKVMLSVG